MIAVLNMRSVHWRAMRRHVSKQAPLEACGVLAGKGGSVEVVLEVRNAEQNPVRFRMDPREQYNAFDWIEANGLELVGIFHSHPSGPDTVSRTDIDEAAYEVVHVLWFLSDLTWHARGFWIEAEEVSEVTLQIVDKQQPNS